MHSSLNADGASILALLTGDAVPPLIGSQTGAMLVHFSSDSSVSASGFYASYRIVCGDTVAPTTAMFGGSVGEPCARASVMTGSSGALRDGPGFYTNMADCSWVILAARPIELVFSTFSLETGFDWVQDNDNKNENKNKNKNKNTNN